MGDERGILVAQFDPFLKGFRLLEWSWGVDGATEDDDANGIEKDKEIKEETHVLHVVQVVFEFAAGILYRRPVGVTDLSPAG